MKEIRIEIPNYIRTVKLSEARKKKYYEKGKKEPKAKKYLDTSKYEWKTFKGRQFLVDLATNERVVANPRAAGTPSIATINGQKIYNNEIEKHTRNKMLGAIKNSFAPYINKLDVIEEFPLKIEMEIHDVIREPSSNALWDVDNRAWPYIKAFQDCLTGNKDADGKKRNRQIIPDDNVLFITRPPSTTYIPIDPEEERKLVFIIKKETDPRILKHKEHSKQLKEAVYEFTRVSNGRQQDVEKGRQTKRTKSLPVRRIRRTR